MLSRRFAPSDYTITASEMESQGWQYNFTAQRWERGCCEIYPSLGHWTVRAWPGSGTRFVYPPQPPFPSLREAVAHLIAAERRGWTEPSPV